MATKTIPIFLPGDKVAWVMAGPTRELPDDRKLVRCAAEIKVDPDRVAFDVSTGDFKPFDENKLDLVLPNIMKALSEGERLYVGCMGGTGRTGTLLAILAGQHPGMTGGEAITYIRQVYRAHAVETSEQEGQVWEFSGERKFTEVRDSMMVELDTQLSKFDTAGPSLWDRFKAAITRLARAG